MTTIKEGDELARELRELRDFLLGVGPLSGAYFGERPAGANGNFWWRGYVRRIDAAIAALRSQHNGATQGDKGKAAIDALWPILGGNHTDAETWREIGDAVCAALSTSSPSGGMVHE